MASLTQLLEEAERALAERAAALRKIADRLSKGRKELGKGQQRLPAVRGLIEEIRTLPREPGGPDWDALADELTRHEAELTGQIRKEFPVGLRDAAEAAGLPFRGGGE